CDRRDPAGKPVAAGYGDTRAPRGARGRGRRAIAAARPTQLRSPAVAMDTARLWMRTLASADDRLYCTLYRDPATMRFIGAPMSAARAARSFRAALAAGRKLPVDDLFLAFVEKATRAPIGMGSLQHFDRTRRRAAAGIMLLPAK